MFNHTNPKNNSCFGAIAEDRTKLPIKVRHFGEKFSSPYEVGDHIELLGRFQLESKNN